MQTENGHKQMLNNHDGMQNNCKETQKGYVQKKKATKRETGNNQTQDEYREIQLAT